MFFLCKPTKVSQGFFDFMSTNDRQDYEVAKSIIRDAMM